MATIEQVKDNPGVIDRLDRVALDTGFSGVVNVDRAGISVIDKAYGLANRAFGVANTVDTRLAIASGTKGFTAVTVMSLIEDGTLRAETTARSILGEHLPMVEDSVTIEQLLTHRSGIGDYLDEGSMGDITDYVMPIPVHRLVGPEDYLAVLDGYETVFEPDEKFIYNNGGYVVLAILAERAAGVDYHDLVQQRVFDPAGMAATGFFRSDELPTDAASGYLARDGVRTNVLHLPARGVGDGGAYSTTADLRAFWRSLLGGRIVPENRVEQMLRVRSADTNDDHRYGIGFWIHRTVDVPILFGYDPGISFRSTYDPATDTVTTVISNWSDGAWRMIDAVDEVVGYTSP